MTSLRAFIFWLAFCLAAAGGRAAESHKPVSYYKEIVPLLKRSCTGCHHPGKLKGQLDLTAYPMLKKGGKHGALFKEGDPKNSLLIEEITGPEPSMPKEGDPLTKEEVALFARWIEEGAKDDTPADQVNPHRLAGPPVYGAPAVISALAYSPDGEVLAVSGYHEVILHKSDGSGQIARLVGESPRIESIAFSPDGKLLAVAGGAPALFGEIQIWNLSSNVLERSVRPAGDSLYGVSFSPDSKWIAFGSADKSVRVIQVADGKELLKFDNHSDWIFGTTFTVDGKRLLTGSRDRAMKLINAANGQFIDDINKLLESVLCISRHPKMDQIAYGGELGTPRIYRISDNQGRTAANNDVNLIREFERQPGPVHAIAYTSDGESLAVGCATGEIRVYKTSDGAKTQTLKGHDGAVFAIVCHPKKAELASGGFDGKLRIYELPSGKLIKEFIPFPIKAAEQVATAAKQGE